MTGPGVRARKAQQILDAAAAVFARLGFGPARMDDVAQEAGVSKGGLYLHFKSKDELIDALVGWLVERETKRILEARAAEGTVESRLIDFVHGYTADVLGMQRLAPVVLETYVRAARHSTVRRALMKFFDSFEAELAGLIEEGVRSGEFGDVDCDVVAIEITALIEGLAMFWLIDAERIDLVSMADSGMRLLLDGLRAEPRPAVAR